MDKDEFRKQIHQLNKGHERGLINEEELVLKINNCKENAKNQGMSESEINQIIEMTE